MFEFEEIRQQIESMEEPLLELRRSLHLDQAKQRVSELETISAEPEFWQDLERAQKVQQELKHLTARINRYEALRQRREDLTVLCDLGAEDGDTSVIPEVEQGLAEVRRKYDDLLLETLFTGEHDSANAIMSLHAGAGGTEAQDWVSMLYRMYLRWAEAREFEVEVLDYLDGDEAGIKSVSVRISGENAYGLLRSEMGVHRLVRISPFDSSGRRHTSFASVEVMPELDDSIEINIRPEDLRVDYYRASGAGGQHVNKTSSAVRLTHLPTGVVVACQNERSQIQNRETAMRMLKAKLYTLAQQAQMEKIEDLKGDQLDIGWGSQIRSYVFCPYTKVKDHRTGYEVGDVDSVMDGEIDGFINAWLTDQNEKNHSAGQTE